MKDTYKVGKVRKPNQKKTHRDYSVDGRIFRYDYSKALLCWIDDDGKNIDAIGLSRDNWAENPEYWCEVYSARIDEELSYLW